MAKKRWSELSSVHKALIIWAGAIQVVLLVAAQIDIHRRSVEEIKGPKSMWRVLAFVNYVGPIAYFTVGRRPEGH